MEWAGWQHMHELKGVFQLRLRRTGLVVSVLLLALLVAACGGSKEESTATNANVEAVEIVIELGSADREFSFNPSEIELKVNQPVRLIAKNVGTVPHDLRIPDLDVDIPPVAVGAEAVVEFTPTKTGTFDMECHEPGHLASGMHGTVTVVQ